MTRLGNSRPPGAPFLRHDSINFLKNSPDHPNRPDNLNRPNRPNRSWCSDIPAQPWKERTEQHFTDLAYNLLDVVLDLADEKNCTPAQVALAWCMNQPGITSPIVGPRTMEQLDDGLQ